VIERLLEQREPRQIGVGEVEPAERRGEIDPVAATGNPKRANTAPRARYAQPMAAVDKLLEQALQLPEKERGELAGRLLKSLESIEDEELSPDAWEAAWSEVLDRRMREVRDGSVRLVDGDAVFQAAARRIASRRP
jgi:hypothetical protein